MLRYVIGFAAVGVVLVVLVLVTRTGPDAAPPQQEVVHSVTGALDGRQTAELEVASGAESVIIHSEPMDNLLYRASTLPGSKVEPVAETQADTVKLRLNGTQIAGQATVHVYLNDHVLWHLKLAGGGLRQTVDFGSGRLSGIDVLSGVQELDVSVPKPEGTMAIHVGGVGRLSVHAPAGPPAQVTLGAKGTIGEIRLDNQQKQNAPGGTVLASDGWGKATDRYDLQVDTAAATVLVDRRA
jgi:hypothetical protein